MSRSKSTLKSLGDYTILSSRFTLEVASTFLYSEACCELQKKQVHLH